MYVCVLSSGHKIGTYLSHSITKIAVSVFFGCMGTFLIGGREDDLPSPDGPTTYRSYIEWEIIVSQPTNSML